MSAQPETDVAETRVENALIRELNKIEIVNALKPDHWDAVRTYTLPQLKIKVVLGRELIVYYGVYAFKCEIELRTKPDKEDGMSAVWLAVRRLIEHGDLDLSEGTNLNEILTDDYLLIGAPAEEITSTVIVAGDDRVRTIRFMLRGYSKI